MQKSLTNLWAEYLGKSDIPALEVLRYLCEQHEMPGDTFFDRQLDRNDPEIILDAQYRFERDFPEIVPLLTHAVLGPVTRFRFTDIEKVLTRKRLIDFVSFWMPPLSRPVMVEVQPPAPNAFMSPSV